MEIRNHLFHSQHQNSIAFRLAVTSMNHMHIKFVLHQTNFYLMYIKTWYAEPFAKCMMSKQMSDTVVWYLVFTWYYLRALLRFSIIIVTVHYCHDHYHQCLRIRDFNMFIHIKNGLFTKSNASLVISEQNDSFINENALFYFFHASYKCFPFICQCLKVKTPDLVHSSCITG